MNNLYASLSHLQTLIYSCFNSVAYTVASCTIWEVLQCLRQAPGTCRYEVHQESRALLKRKVVARQGGVFETWRSVLTCLHFLPFYWSGEDEVGWWRKKKQQNKNLRKPEKLILLIKYELTLVSCGRYVICK